jgi:DtxR family transcriptional regulator, Mn-dependent transcriptional regulator
MYSRSIEDYLKHIYQLQAAGSKVNTTTLAGVLSVSPASVSEMVSKLSKPGWIENTPYKGFSLTEEGEKIAVNLVRKHRLIEVFLHQHLGYSWDEVHNEAEKFEHVCSDRFINKLDEYLGFPQTDPHGDPIPDINGKIADKKNRLLCDVDTNKSYIVRKVNDISDEVLKYVSSIGIELNTEIKLSEKIAFDESVLISINNMEHLLSRKIAENIFVEELTD